MTFTEVIKVKDGVFCNLTPHFKRMSQTTRHFFGCDIDTRTMLQKDIIPPTLHKGVVKCRVIYSHRIISIDFQPYTYRIINKLSLVEDNQIEYNYKYQDRERINDLLKQRGEADEILIVKNGMITDTSFTNVVFCDHNGGLFTPDTYLLTGIKRQTLLEKGVIHQRPIAIGDIVNYSAIYLINAMIDIEDKMIVPIPMYNGDCK